MLSAVLAGLASVASEWQPVHLAPPSPTEPDTPAIAPPAFDIKINATGKIIALKIMVVFNFIFIIFK